MSASWLSRCWRSSASASPLVQRLVGFLDFPFPVLLGLALAPLELGLDPVLGLVEQLLGILE